MKIIYTPRELVERYYVNPAINQGVLKTLGNSLASYQRLINKPPKEQELYFYESEMMLIGSAVDLLVTSEEPLSKYYYISNVDSKPSDAICSILKEASDGATTNDIYAYKVEILDICERVRYQPNWGADAKWKIFYPHWELFKEYVNGRGKILLSVDEVQTINMATHALKEQVEFNSMDNEDNALFYQYPMYFKLYGIECKGLLDLMVVNHVNKTIRLIDFKVTSFPLIDFLSPMRSRRYDFQAAFYTEGARTLAKKGYTVLPFEFHVFSTYDNEASVFVCSQELLDDTFEGFEVRGKRYAGIHESLMIYKWYEDNGYSKDFITQFPVKTLTWDKIIYS